MRIRWIDQIEIYETMIATNNRKYFTGIDVNAIIDKEALFSYLVLEYGEMSPLDNDTITFRNRIINFFQIHKWNIDKLCDTLQLEYNPLNNTGWTQKRNIDRDISEITDNTVDTTGHNDTEWDESGSQRETDVHFVSAFNDKESPEQTGVDAQGYPIYKYNDTEEYRDTMSMSYSKNGTNNQTMQEKSQQDKMVNTDDVTTDDIVRTGNSGVSYQSLIEEERKQAEYNIYKWIARHFCKELMIAVW